MKGKIVFTISKLTESTLGTILEWTKKGELSKEAKYIGIILYFVRNGILKVECY